METTWEKEETDRNGEPMLTATRDGLRVVGRIRRANEWADVSCSGRFDWTTNRYDGTPTKPTPESVLITWRNYRVEARHDQSVWWVPDADMLADYHKWETTSGDKQYAKRTVYSDAQMATRLEEVTVEATVYHPGTGVELGSSACGTDHDSDEELDSAYARRLLDDQVTEALEDAHQNLRALAAS